jgi:sugar phosphate isomerase/epimerase
VIPLAVSSWSWHSDFYAGHLHLADVPAAAVALGFDQVELNDFMLPSPRFGRVRRFFSVRPAGPQQSWRYDDASLHRLKAELDRTGVHCLAWTVDADLTVPGRYWPAHERYLHRAMGTARLLGATVLRVSVGGAADQSVLADGRVVNRLGKLVMASQRLCPGLTLAVENHWGITTDFRRLLAILDGARMTLPAAYREQVGVCFDPGNLPAADRAEGWPYLAWQARHFHFKTHTFTPSGDESTLPYDLILAMLVDSGYTGATTIEFEGDGDPADGIRRSAALWLRLMDGVSG